MTRMEHAARLYRKGYSPGEIAALMAVTRSTVYVHLHRARKRGALTMRSREQHWMEVARLSKEGLPLRVIADRTKLTYGTVKVYRAHAREAGDL